MVNLAVAAAAAFMLAACSDSPSSIGAGILTQDEIKLNKFVSDTAAQSSYSFKRTIKPGASNRLLLGRVGGAEAVTLVRFHFQLPDSIISNFGSVTIDSAQVTLRTIYNIGDAGAAFGFTVHRITSEWSTSDFTSDSLNQVQYEPADIASDKNPGDSLFTFRLGSDLVKGWAQYSIDSGGTKNDGIILIPTAETGRAMGFEAIVAAMQTLPAPQLTFTARNSDGNRTVITVPAGVDISVVSGPIADTGADNLTIQGGITVSAKIGFDVSSIPVHAAVTNAKLTLTMDPGRSILGTPDDNRLFVYFVRDTANIQIGDTTAVTALTRSGNVYTGDVTSFAQIMVREQGNYGFVAASGSQTTGMEVVAIKGSNAADAAVKPRLEIIYTSEK